MRALLQGPALQILIFPAQPTNATPKNDRRGNCSPPSEHWLSIGFRAIEAATIVTRGISGAAVWPAVDRRKK